MGLFPVIKTIQALHETFCPAQGCPKRTQGDDSPSPAHPCSAEMGSRAQAVELGRVKPKLLVALLVVRTGDASSGGGQRRASHTAKGTATIKAGARPNSSRLPEKGSRALVTHGTVGSASRRTTMRTTAALDPPGICASRSTSRSTAEGRTKRGKKGQRGDQSSLRWRLAKPASRAQTAAQTGRRQCRVCKGRNSPRGRLGSARRGVQWGQSRSTAGPAVDGPAPHSIPATTALASRRRLSVCHSSASALSCVVDAGLADDRQPATT